MKAKQQVFLTASSLLLVSYASAQTIVSYDSGVTAAIGQSGAADPTSQGWTYTGSGSGYSDGYDSGDGGYRTVDGTTTTVSWYQNDIAALDVTTLTSAPGWTLDWTASIDSSALLEGGGGVTNYYLPPNQSRVSSVAMWFELTGSYTYILEFETDASGNLFVNDGTTAHQITAGGSNNAYDTFYDYSLSFDGSQATLSVDGGSAINIASSAVDTGNNRVLFGSYSGTGQGSMVWNDVTLAAVPEPGSFALLAGVCGLAFAAIRRRR